MGHGRAHATPVAGIGSGFNTECNPKRLIRMNEYPIDPINEQFYSLLPVK